jgi:hypothetical protein
LVLGVHQRESTCDSTRPPFRCRHCCCSSCSPCGPASRTAGTPATSKTLPRGGWGSVGIRGRVSGPCSIVARLAVEIALCALLACPSSVRWDFRGGLHPVFRPRAGTVGDRLSVCRRPSNSGCRCGWAGTGRHFRQGIEGRYWRLLRRRQRCAQRLLHTATFARRYRAGSNSGCSQPSQASCRVAAFCSAGVAQGGQTATHSVV